MDGDRATATGSVPALDAGNLAKTFGGQVALAGVDLTIEQGEVLALLGANGSGKSTLVKILSGYHVPEPGGRLRVAGRAVPLPVPQDRYRDYGLGFVFQDLGLAPGLRVMENLFVGRRTRKGARELSAISWRSERAAAKAVLGRYRVDLDPDALVGALRPTDQALLAIVRAAEDLRLFRERHPPDRRPGPGAAESAARGVLVLDEPTVFLPQDEKAFLFDLVGRVAANGTAMLFVSHDMTAIRQIADRALVLRDGSVVGDVAMGDTTDEGIIELIAGHRTAMRPEPAGGGGTAHAAGATAVPGGRAGPLLLARDLAGGRITTGEITVAAGEVVGVAGLLGSGAEDLPYALFGALHGVRGRISVRGRVADLARLDPRDARELGLALVPGDRKRQAAAEGLSFGENVMSLVLGDYFRFGALARGRLRRTAEERCRSHGVRPPDPSASLSSLSGGNQQRVVLARWLERVPAVLLLHEPTQGVDVATRAELYRMLRDVADGGAGILWVSTDFGELATVADRVLVCAGGAVVSELTAKPFDRNRITSEVYAAHTRPDQRSLTSDGQ